MHYEEKLLSKPTMTKSVNILSLILLIAAHSQIAIGKTHVHITNRLEQGRKLTINCRSSDDDLGVIMLSDGHEMSWSFSPNFWGTTLFYCRVMWPGSDGWLRFDAYDESRDRKRCSLCKWMIANDGFLYGFEPDCGQWKLYSLIKNIPGL